MHKCNSTLNTLSSIANQSASLPLAMRFYLITRSLRLVTPLQFGLRAKRIFRGVGHGSNIDLVITFCFEWRYAAAIYKNCLYLTSFLSQIDRLVSFQLQIQHEKSIEDLNSGMYANRVSPASQYSAGILNSALRLPSNRSDH